MGTGESNPIEWLQYIANSFSGLADMWDDCDSDDFDTDYLEAHFEEYKNDFECPDISKLEMYEEVLRTASESVLHAYLYDSMDTFHDIERNRENVLKAFANKTIFPNLLMAIGIIESVISEAKASENSFYHYLYYCVASTPEIAGEWFGERAVERYKKNPILTEDDYEGALGSVAELIEIIEKNQFSAKLRESAWAIKGYCKLNAESPEKYAEIEAEIAKRKRPRRKTPPQLLKETRERQAVRELAKNDKITAEELGKILGCNKSTVVRLKAWQSKGILAYSPPQNGFKKQDNEGKTDVEAVSENEPDEDIENS